jgi:hypothetical protein
MPKCHFQGGSDAALRQDKCQGLQLKMASAAVSVDFVKDGHGVVVHHKDAVHIA